MDPEAPLQVDVRVDDAALVVEHPRRPRPPRPGAGLGLKNLDARVRAATGLPLGVEDGATFLVSVPLAERS